MRAFLELRSLRAGSHSALVLLGLALAGCATSARVPPPAPVAGVPATPATSAGIQGQWLFRAEVASAEGAGSLRLVLRRHDSTRFTLQAADAFGQVRWEIRSERDAAVWIEPMGQRYCRLDARAALRTAQWVSNIAVSDIAGLLTGDWPPRDAPGRSPAPPSSLRYPGGALQHFTGATAGKEWTSWTLWEGSEPVAWWKRIGMDALLSVRQPAVQVRWRVTARGNLGESVFQLIPGELSASAREIDCPDNAIP